MLNGTFIIQAGNFLCAYVILDVLLFRPVCAIIAQEDAVRQGKLSAIDQELILQEGQQRKIKQFWAELTHEFEQKRPFVLQREAARHYAQRPALVEITPSETQHVVTQAVTFLVERCAHVRK